MRCRPAEKSYLWFERNYTQALSSLGWCFNDTVEGTNWYFLGDSESSLYLISGGNRTEWSAIRPVRPNKKNMCFCLPNVPKFRSPTLIFLLSFGGFYN